MRIARWSIAVLVSGCNPPTEVAQPPAGHDEDPSHAGGAGHDEAARPAASLPTTASSVDPSATATPSASPTPTDPSTAPPVPAPPALEQQIRAALPPPDERPVADEPPHPVGNRWLTPGGSPITHTFILEWSRPEEQDGWPTTVFIAEPERTYWVHEGFLQGGLSTQRVWFGPFVLDPPG